MAFSLDRAMRDDRRETRVSVRMLAILRWNRGELGVVIHNLSSRGAMLRGGKLPEERTDAVLDVSGTEIAAVVAWCNPPFCGLSFQTAIDPPAVYERARQSRTPAKVALTLGPDPSEIGD